MPKRPHDPELLALIGNRIQEARLARGMTQAILAEKLRIEVATLSRYEGGHKGPSITTIAAAADVLDVAVGDLVDEDRELPEPQHRPEVEDAIRLLEELDDDRRDLACRLLHEVAK